MGVRAFTLNGLMIDVCRERKDKTDEVNRRTRKTKNADSCKDS